LTCLIGISASQTTLPLFAIFKGKNIPQELQEIDDPNLVVAMSKNAWMTEEGFYKWIHRIWRPYAENFQRTLLVLDQFKVHKISKVLEELEKCRTDVLFIPPGLTFFLQPCDVFLNKPFKQNVHNSWQKFMIDHNNNNSGSSYLIMYY